MKIKRQHGLVYFDVIGHQQNITELISNLNVIYSVVYEGDA